MNDGKGISPLIAAVILIAFMVAIAGITSDFFLGFTKKQKGEVERRGESTVHCSLGNINVQSDSVNLNETEDSVQVTVENIGQIKIKDMLVVAYNKTMPVTYNATPSTISSGTVKSISSSHPGGALEKISVRSSSCPGIESTVKNESGSWTSV